jgi:glycogen synthase
MRRALAAWTNAAGSNAALTNQGSWSQLVRNGMAQDWSWGVQGPRYVDLYTRLAASAMAR